MKKFWILFVWTVFIGFQQQSVANGTGPVTLTNEIKQLLKKDHIPGASVAVIRNGKILWAKGFGYADLTSKRPINTHTLFQACSITKTFTSTAVLQVLQKNHISLDALVNLYLKRWKIPDNQFTSDSPVTLRMLLNHTAAISNPYPDGGYAYDAKLPTLTQVFLGLPPATNPPLHVTEIPGTKYQYCNGCYSILQMFLEDVTGESYPEIIRKQILNPLEMKNSYFDNRLFLKSPNQVALPYNANRVRFKNAPITNPIYSTGLLWTTPSDLAKFMIAQQQSLNTEQGFLPQKLALSLITPSSTPTRGLGFFIGDKAAHEKANGEYIFHTGNNIGYLTLLIGSRDGKNGAAIMINISPEWNAKDYPQFEFIRSSLKLIANYYHWK